MLNSATLIYHDEEGNAHMDPWAHLEAYVERYGLADAEDFGAVVNEFAEFYQGELLTGSLFADAEETVSA